MFLTHAEVRAAVAHALECPHDAARWVVAADAAEEASFPVALRVRAAASYALLPGACAVLRKKSLPNASFCLLAVTLPSDEGKTRFPVYTTICDVNDLVDESELPTLYLSESGPIEKEPYFQTVFGAFPAFTLEPGQEESVSYLSPVWAKVQRLVLLRPPRKALRLRV